MLKGLQNVPVLTRTTFHPPIPSLGVIKGLQNVPVLTRTTYHPPIPSQSVLKGWQIVLVLPRIKGERKFFCWDVIWDDCRIWITLYKHKRNNDSCIVLWLKIGEFRRRWYYTTHGHLQEHTTRMMCYTWAKLDVLRNTLWSDVILKVVFFSFIALL